MSLIYLSAFISTASGDNGFMHVCQCGVAICTACWSLPPAARACQFWAGCSHAELTAVLLCSSSMPRTHRWSDGPSLAGAVSSLQAESQRSSS